MMRSLLQNKMVFDSFMFLNIDRPDLFVEILRGTSLLPVTYITLIFGKLLRDITKVWAQIRYPG